MTANEKLQDLLLERSLILERIKGSVSNDLTKIYDELFKDISKRINESDLTIKESERLIKLLEKDLVIPYAELGNDLNALAQDESKFLLNAVNAAAGIDIATTLPTNKTINKIANASLMEGATIKNWFGSLEQSLQFDVAREVRQSIIQGKTNKEVTDSLKAILNTSSRNARTLALTGIATVTNQVRQQTVKENEDIFKGQKTVVTFDGRTSDICISYSNSSWDMEGKILTGNKAFREPPYHMRCRTILLPIIKSFRELGINLDEMKGATKASMDGQIPKDMTFDEWLKTKPKSFVESTLGKGRAELFLDGKINLSQLTDLRGNPLTIKELTNIQTPKIVVPKNIVPKVPKIDFGYDGKFNKYVEDIRDEAKIVIDKLPKPLSMAFVKSNAKKRVGSYNPVTKSILIQKDSSRNIIHEYGHHIDNIVKPNIIRSQFVIEQVMSDDKKFTDSFNKYKDMYKYTSEKVMLRLMQEHDIPKYSPLVDIFDAFTEGQMARAGLGGHGATYYETSKLQNREVFAHLFQSWSQNDRWETYNKLFPDLTRDFEAIMKEVIDGKFD